MRKNFNSVILSLLVLPCAAYAQENVNLLKNSELKLNTDRTLSGWGGNATFSPDAGRNGASSVRMTVEKQARTCFQLTMTQQVKDLKPGKYIFSAYLKADRKIREIQLSRIIKDVYQTENIKAAEQPEPGVWFKAVLEFEMPEGDDSAMIAFDIRDSSAGANIWACSPLLYRKSEQ